MTVYINKNYEIYTEETIDKEIAQRFNNGNYDGVIAYMTDHYSDKELFAMLPSNIQAEILEDAKERILDIDFFEREIDDSKCPFSKCPYIK